MSHKPGGRLPLLSPGPQLPCSYGCMKNLTEISAAKLAGSSPRNPYKGCYQFCCLVNRGMMGVNSLPKTVTRHRRGCDLNPGPTAPESSTLTTRLPSHPHCDPVKDCSETCRSIFVISKTFEPQIAVATLSDNSLRQTVHTHCVSVHQPANW